MRTYSFIFLLITLVCSKNTYGQWNSIVNFTPEQETFMREIANFLKTKHNGTTDVFSYDISNYLIVIDPFGTVYDSASFKYAKFIGDSLPVEAASKDSIYFRSERVAPGSEKVAVYNNGNTLIYCYGKVVSMYIYGNPVEFKETKLETYIKQNGKWIMVANSGTEIRSYPTNSNK